MSHKTEDDSFENWLKLQWWISLHAKHTLSSDFFNKLEKQLREIKKWENYLPMDESINEKISFPEKERLPICRCPCYNNRRDSLSLNSFLDLDNQDVSGESNQTPEDTDSSIDVIEWDDTISITIETPMTSLDGDIDIDVVESEVIIEINGEESRYYKKVQLPCKVDKDYAKTSYQNGILDIELKKKIGTIKKRFK